MNTKGSYTVEAALLMPFILGVIVALIYLGFFLHDRTVLEETVYMAALKASFYESKGDSYMEELMKNECENVIANKLLIAGNCKVTVEADSNDLMVKITGNMTYPGFRVLKSIGISGSISIQETEELKLVKPEQIIRTYRIAEGLVKE